MKVVISRDDTLLREIEQCTPTGWNGEQHIVVDDVWLDNGTVYCTALGSSRTVYRFVRFSTRRGKRGRYKITIWEEV